MTNLITCRSLILSVLTLLISCLTAPAQRLAMSGVVTEVLTGDTIVVQTSQAKFTIKLQYADAPEATQPLHGVVKTHLSNFVLQKTINFELKSLSAGTHHSKIFLNGVDLSLQMLRDGAAWYSVPDGASQAVEERAAYMDAETKAREEKRGVWGIAGIKPAYELRLQREKELQEALQAERKKWLESALALMKFSEPSVGMNYFAFESLCSPSQSGDSSSTSDFGNGVSIRKSLVWTKERDDTGCYGSFSFDERRKLTYIGRSSKVQ